ncbi:hypothetical protein, partial [Acinetobacter baumannii]|uniref:hypothetical protein n=1 Tax=Acinetobacter baumannii TaxID=470 RepID=UPI001D0F35FF
MKDFKTSENIKILTLRKTGDVLTWNAVKSHTLTPGQLWSVRGDGSRLSSVVLGDRTGGNGQQMKHRRFCLN